MRVLQVNITAGTGSVGRIAVDIYSEILSEGNECCIAYGKGKPRGISDEDTYKIISKLGLYKHALASRITDRAGFYSKNETEKLVEYIKSYKPDVVQLHGNYGYYLHIGVLMEYLKSSHTPTVLTLHSCWDFTGHCCYFTYPVCEKWKTGCYSCPRKGDYPESFVLDSSNRNYADKKKLMTGINTMTLVSPSQWLADLVRESFLSNYPVEVIRNGIDLNVFKPTDGDVKKRYGITNKRILLAVANVWSKRKGLEDVLTLSSLLPAEFVTVIVGVSRKQRKELPSRVIGIEHTDSIEELAELYSVADYLFNPTYEDNFPTVNLESMACGTPVITYNTGGSPESLSNNTGVVVNKQEWQAVLRYISRTPRKPVDECVMAAKQFGRKVMARNYVDLYKKILEKENNQT